MPSMVVLVRYLRHQAMSAWVRGPAGLKIHFSAIRTVAKPQARTHADIAATTSYFDGHLISYFGRHSADSSYSRGRYVGKDRISVDVETNSIDRHRMRGTLFIADTQVG
jgi:hypothetical protein